MADRQPGGDDVSGSAARPEDHDEQRERYRELLEETRTVLPGVQVLFAFLLTVPFSSRFVDLDPLSQNVLTGVIVGVALSTVLLMAPAAYHRVGDRQRRATRLALSTRLAVVGMSLLALSVAAAIFVVVRFILESTVAGVVLSVVVLATVAVFWYAVPLLGRSADGGPDEEPTGAAPPADRA